MYKSGDKMRQRIFFTLAWINAIFAVTRFIPSCSNVSKKEGISHAHSGQRYYKLTISEEKELETRLDDATRKRKIIVAWDWSKIAKFPKPLEKLTRSCGSCTVIYNDNLKIKDNGTAAVVFNYKTVRAGNMPLRSLRRSDQLYVWQCGESPISLKNGMLKTFVFEDMRQFNATMTLRRDSDIVFAYGSAVQAMKAAKKMLKHHYGGDLRNMIRSKSGIATTVISNCKFLPGARLRVELIERLENHGLKVDKYGACFDNILGKGDASSDSFEPLQKYKFYLAFENSFHCKDYITEKFFSNGLGHGMVPVVWGARRDDYEAVAPPHSFIHVDDFKSVEELADRLIYLSENDEAYMEYFRWYHLPERDMPNFRRTTGFCQLCRIIHGINVDDIYRPDFDPENPKRPLFTPNAAIRTLGSMKRLVYSKEEKDCFKNTGSVRQTSDTLMARG